MLKYTIMHRVDPGHGFANSTILASKVGWLTAGRYATVFLNQEEADTLDNEIFDFLRSDAIYMIVDLGRTVWTVERA